MTIHTSRSSGLGLGNAGADDTPATVVTLDRQAVRAAISAAAERFTALLREIDDIGRPAAGTDWTVAETAAHVSVVFTGFSAAIAGEPQALTPERYLDADFPTRLAASNAATNAMVDQTDAGRLAEMITAGAQQFLKLVAAADPEMECETPWYGPGRTRTVDCLTALALSELTVHGYDIATGADLRRAREAHPGHGVPRNGAAGGAARGGPRRAGDVRGPVARRRPTLRRPGCGRHGGGAGRRRAGRLCDLRGPGDVPTGCLRADAARPGADARRDAGARPPSVARAAFQEPVLQSVTP